jgi:GntR family transcriptional regulator, transcriptional repressor for pyruvate dehydrogenase complex
VILLRFETINKQTSPEMITSQIKEKITSGTIKAGEKLPSEKDLSRQFGVSRTCIREAIQALSFSGYLDVIQGKGAFVNDVKKQIEIAKIFRGISDISLADLIEVRILLECGFAQLAALNANDDDIKKILKLFKIIKESKDLEMFVINELNLHLAIASATHNRMMINLFKIFSEILNDKTYEFKKYSFENKEFALNILSKLTNAIESRNSAEAGVLMEEHLSHLKGFLGDIKSS